MQFHCHCFQSYWTVNPVCEATDVWTLHLETSFIRKISQEVNLVKMYIIRTWKRTYFMENMRCLIQYWYIVNSISFLHMAFTEVKTYTDMLTILYKLHAKVEFLLKLYCELFSSLCMREKKRKPSPEYQGFLHNCEVHNNYCYIYITWIQYDFWMQLKSFLFHLQCQYFAVLHKKLWIITKFWNPLSTHFQQHKVVFLVIYFYFS